ncbi:MAG: ArdC family protein, partial [Candidatus Adiutrix sp.]|nr:ArdC family protein [Candidatus Adiutrix sp.]
MNTSAQTAQTNPQHEIIAPIIEQIRNGKSFLVNKNEAGALRVPLNPATGNAYSGINRLILTAIGESDPRWMTRNQAEKEGYAPKDNAAPRKLVFWDSFKKIPLKGEDGQALRDEDGQMKTKTIRLERPEMRFYDVYHAKDLARADGQEMPPYEASPQIGDAGARLSVFLEKSGAEIDLGGAENEDERQALTVHALCGQISQKQSQAPDDQFWRRAPAQYPEQHLSVTVASLYATQD